MNIEEQKEKLNQLEIKQANLHLEYLKKRRSQFDFADTSQWIALNRKEEDLLLLGDAFTRWSSALKDGDTIKLTFDTATEKIVIKQIKATKKNQVVLDIYVG